MEIVRKLEKTKRDGSKFESWLCKTENGTEEWFSVFDTELFKFSEGDNIHANVKTKGTFKNIVSAEKNGNDIPVIDARTPEVKAKTDIREAIKEATEQVMAHFNLMDMTELKEAHINLIDTVLKWKLWNGRMK